MTIETKIVSSVPDFQDGFRGPFPNGNIFISEDGLVLIDTTQGGINNISIGNGALAESITANSTVAIGTNAGKIFGQKHSLITNGSFDSPASWVTGVGWSIAGGKAKHTAGSASSLTQIASLVANVPYSLVYTISGRTAGTVQPITSGGGTPKTGVTRSTNNIFNEFIRVNTGNTQLEFAASSDFDGSIDDVVFETLDGRTGVFIGFNTAQYVGNGPSNTFVGAYCAQGQEKDITTGLDISGTHPLDGTDNCGYGEACLIRIRGGASNNCGYGFNSLFNLTTGSANIAIGVGSGQELSDTNSNIILGTNSYQFGWGASNVFIGDTVANGTRSFTALKTNVAVGDKTFGVTDASIFQVNGAAVCGTFINEKTTVTAVDLIANTITVDKAAWNTANVLGGAINVFSVPSPHTGTDNVGIGRSSLLVTQGAAQRNTAVGAIAGLALTTGSQNTLIGRQSGYTLTSGTDNIVIGNGATTSSPTAVGEMNLGNAITATSITTANPRIGIRTTSPSGALDINSDRIRVRTAFTPASASASGNAGEIAWDANYIYICTDTNTWKRSAIATW